MSARRPTFASFDRIKTDKGLRLPLYASLGGRLFRPKGGENVEPIMVSLQISNKHRNRMSTRLLHSAEA